MTKRKKKKKETVCCVTCYTPLPPTTTPPTPCLSLSERHHFKAATWSLQWRSGEWSGHVSRYTPPRLVLLEERKENTQQVKRRGSHSQSSRFGCSSFRRRTHFSRFLAPAAPGAATPSLCCGRSIETTLFHKFNFCHHLLAGGPRAVDHILSDSYKLLLSVRASPKDSHTVARWDHLDSHPVLTRLPSCFIFVLFFDCLCAVGCSWLNKTLMLRLAFPKPEDTGSVTSTRASCQTGKSLLIALK